MSVDCWLSNFAVSSLSYYSLIALNLVLQHTAFLFTLMIRAGLKKKDKSSFYRDTLNPKLLVKLKRFGSSGYQYTILYVLYLVTKMFLFCFSPLFEFSGPRSILMFSFTD